MCVYGRKHGVGTAHDYPEHPRPKSPAPPRHHYMAMTPGCMGTAQDYP